MYQVRSSTLGKSVSFELSSSDKRRTLLGLGLGLGLGVGVGVGVRVRVRARVRARARVRVRTSGARCPYPRAAPLPS